MSKAKHGILKGRGLEKVVLAGSLEHHLGLWCLHLAWGPEPLGVGSWWLAPLGHMVTSCLSTGMKLRLGFVGLSGASCFRKLHETTVLGMLSVLCQACGKVCAFTTEIWKWPNVAWPGSCFQESNHGHSRSSFTYFYIAWAAHEPFLSVSPEWDGRCSWAPGQARTEESMKPFCSKLSQQRLDTELVGPNGATGGRYMMVFWCPVQGCTRM